MQGNSQVVDFIQEFVLGYYFLKVNEHKSMTNVVISSTSPVQRPSRNTCDSLSYSCQSRVKIKTPENNSANFIGSVPAIGFDYVAGPLWSIVCSDTKYGTVPGKLTKDKIASFPWGGKEHSCLKWEPIFGELVFSTAPLPEDCNARGFQSNDNRYYYNILYISEHGMIPGKALKDLSFVCFGFGGKEYCNNKTRNYYIIC